MKRRYRYLTEKELDQLSRFDWRWLPVPIAIGLLPGVIMAIVYGF